MTTKPNGYDPTRDPGKKFKYGYGMHPDFKVKPKPKPINLMDNAYIDDPDLREIKRALRLDLDRILE